MIKKIVITVFVLVAIAGLAFLMFNRDAQSDNSLTHIKVTRGDIVEKAIAIGSIEPGREIAVKSKISGIVSRLYVEIGDEVRPGDPLLEIRPDPTPLELAEARRQVELADVAFLNAQKRFDRAQELLDKKHLSQADYDNAVQDVDESRLRLQLARERLSLIADGKTTGSKGGGESIIRSPAAGTILAREVDEGDPVVPLTSFQSGTELLTMAAMDDLMFRGTVDEIDVGKLNEGMDANIKVGALPETRIAGMLYKISPKARMEDNTTLFDVEVHLADMPDAPLRAGYSANAEVIIEKRDSVLLLPERLITTREDSSFVEIPDELGEPKELAIATGLSDGLNIEIVAGLSEGDSVIERPPREIE